MKGVVISVAGGVAEVAYCSDGVGVEIVDFDNMEADGLQSDERDGTLGVAIERAKHNEPDNSKCPRCGSEELEGGAIEIVGRAAGQECSCLKCGAQWSEVYEFREHGEVRGGIES